MRHFMKELEQSNELVVVDRQVDPKYELAAVTHKVQETTNEAILFRNVCGTSFPVVTNLYGSRARLARVLGTDVSNFCRSWSAFLEDREGGAGDTDSRMPPDEIVSGTLDELPLLWYNERDGAPYFTSAIYLAKDPETGVRNLSFHRSMYISEHELRVRLAPTHDLTRYHGKAEAAGRPLEAALLIGVPPELFLAAAAPVPYDVDEVSVASRLAKRAIPMRPCRTIDLSVPAETEIVVEGRFLSHVRRAEGPFGEFMGYYVENTDSPVFEVSDVSWRSGAVFHSINCGSAEEVLTLEVSVAAAIYQRISSVLPGVRDVACNPFVNHVVVQVEQQYEGHPRQVILAAMGAEPTWCKMCTVVDEDVDIYDLRDVMWAILTRARLDTSLLTLPSIPSFYRDPHRDHWGRLGIDACAPYTRRSEFLRKRIPGADRVVLSDYLVR